MYTVGGTSAHLRFDLLYSQSHCEAVIELDPVITAGTGVGMALYWLIIVD